MSLVHYNTGVFYAWIDGVLTTIPIGGGGSGGSSVPGSGFNPQSSLDGLESEESFVYPITGPTGPSGPAGINGIAGIRGANGAPGIDGQSDEPFEPILFNQPSLDNVAYTNRANNFTQNQLISKTRPDIQFLDSGTAKARVGQYRPNKAYQSTNLSYDGTNWNLDDTSLPGMTTNVDPGNNAWLMYSALAGANPATLTQIFRVTDSGLFQLTQGIRFPATQVADSNVNTLDDYEEGSWTPIITGQTSSSGQVFNVQGGRYVKIGKLVHIQGEVRVSTLGTITGAVCIGGLPFTSVSGSDIRPNINLSGWEGLNTAAVFMNGVVLSNSTLIRLAIAASASTTLNVFNQSDLTNNSGFAIGGTYIAAN